MLYISYIKNYIDFFIIDWEHHIVSKKNSNKKSIVEIFSKTKKKYYLLQIVYEIYSLLICIFIFNIFNTFNVSIYLKLNNFNDETVEGLNKKKMFYF